MYFKISEKYFRYILLINITPDINFCFVLNIPYTLFIAIYGCVVANCFCFCCCCIAMKIHISEAAERLLANFPDYTTSVRGQTEVKV